MIEFRALGPLEVVVDDDVASVGGARQRRLLTMLVIHRNSVVSVGALAEAVFAGEPTEAAPTTLRSYVARVRRVVGADSETADVAVVTQAPGYLLKVPAGAIDVDRFERLLHDGQRLLAVGDPATAAATLREAIGLWRGLAFAEFADEEWAQPEAQRLEELRLVAEERLIDAELACGHAAEVIGHLEALVAAMPLRETLRAQQMLALYRSGRQVDALRVFREYRELLIDEVGLDPSPSLVDLERRILDHDPTLTAAETAGEPLLGYRLGARIGIGPNGTMFAARVPGLADEFVVSVLHDDRVDDPAFIGSFEAAAQQVASLRHRAVVALHDFWRVPGAAYLVSRRPPSRTLRERLEQGPMTLEAVAELVRRVGGALAAAERRGVQHGWITPDNVFIDDQGEASIANFVVLPRTPCDDIHDFAVLIEECLHGHRGGLDRAGEFDAVLAGGLSVEYPSMATFVVALLDSFSAGTPAEDLDRPNPFKGLMAFDETDSDRFFGRGEVVDELLSGLESPGPPSRLTLVVGGSGSGKSSVVRAGVVPRVRRGDVRGSAPWFVTTMLPGSSPFKELVEALRRIAVDDIGEVAESLFHGRVTLDDVVGNAVPGSERVLLVIDQLEELFTLTPDAEQGRFLDCLADAVQHPGGRLHVIATLRADFYDRPLAFQRFGALVHDATVAVPAMAPSGLESAIVRPLEAIGARADPALVAEMIAAVADQPAALPSLQFTLFELAQRRTDRCPTLEDYRNLGGVAAAIASRAETLYLSLDEAGRAATRRLFERLVVFGDDGEATSRRSHRSALASGVQAAEVEAVIDRWTAARLLMADVDPRTRVPVVQVAHEALLGTWPRLREWLEEDRGAILALNHLREASASWLELGRDDGALYRGVRLEAALELTESGRDELTAEELEFVAASTALRQREEQSAADHLHRQERANRRLRVQFAVIAAALVVSLAVGALALSQRSNAEAQRRVAVGRELAAASVLNLGDDPERSMLLALEAVDKTRSDDGSAMPEAEDSLRRAVAASRVLVTVPGVGGRLDWSPTENLFVTEGVEESGIVDIRDASTGESVRTFRGDDVDINDVRFSNDGSMLAVTGDDGTASILDAHTGEELATINGEGGSWNPSFSADGTRVATLWWGESMIRVNDTKTGATVAEFPDLDSGVVELSPDGRQLVVARGWRTDEAADGSPIEVPPVVVIIDVDTGDEIMTLEGSEDEAMNEVAWSPSGDRIAAGSMNGVARIWNAATGAMQSVGTGHETMIVGLDWSADGSHLATGGNDGTARVWDLGTDAMTAVFRFVAQDLGNGVPGVAFSPEGDRLVAAGWLITSAKVFDLRPEGASELAGFRPSSGASVGMAFTPDGTGLVTAVDDGIVGVWNVDDGSRRTTIAGPPSPGISVNPNGDVAVVAGEQGFPVVLRDLSSGSELASFDVRDGGLDDIEWSPDGTLLTMAYGAEDGSVVMVLDRSMNVLAETRFPDQFVSDVSLDRSNTRVAIARSGRTRFDPVNDLAIVWDWRHDEVVATLDEVATLVEFDPTSDLLAGVRSNGSSPVLWDARTGERLREFFGHSGLIGDLRFSTDGSVLVSGSADGTARVWDPSTGEQRAVLRTDAAIAAVAVEGERSAVATQDETGVVRIWALDLDELVDIARSRVTRDLTDAECQQYLHRDRCAA